MTYFNLFFFFTRSKVFFISVIYTFVVRNFRNLSEKGCCVIRYCRLVSMNILSYEMTEKSRKLLCTSTSCKLVKSKFYIKRNKVEKKHRKLAH